MEDSFVSMRYHVIGLSKNKRERERERERESMLSMTTCEED